MQIKKNIGTGVYIIFAILSAGIVVSMMGCRQASSKSGEITKTMSNTNSIPTANNASTKMTAADLQRIQNDPAQSPQQKAAAVQQFARQH